MLNFIAFVILVACAAAFILLYLQKVGLVEHMQINAPKLLSKLFSCHFCLSFWFSAIISLFLACYFKDVTLLFIPIFSAPITRILI